MVFSQEDDPRGITTRGQTVVTSRTALILREKAEKRVLIRGTPKERRIAHIRAPKEAVKGNLKARMLVNSQTQF